MKDLTKIKNIPYIPKLEYDLIPKRIAYLKSLKVGAALNLGLVSWNKIIN